MEVGLRRKVGRAGNGKTEGRGKSEPSHAKQNCREKRIGVGGVGS